MAPTATSDASDEVHGSDDSTPSLIETHCPFCALNCGLGLRTRDGAILGTEKWAASPLTEGALCIKGRVAHEQVHHRERLRRPLLRRGTDFREIDWDDALDRAVWGFERIAKAEGRDANAVLSGGSLTNEKVYLIGKLARLAFGTRHVDYNGRFCMVSAGAAHTKAFGVDRMMTPLSELENSEVVVVVGTDLSASFPVRIPRLVDGVRRRGGQVIVVDPRASRFVKNDDIYVQLKPGTDAVFFGGVLREVAARGLLASEFIDQRTNGSAEALAAVEALTPEHVASVCDISPELVRQVAAVVGATRHAMWLHGRGPEQQVGGVMNVLSIINVGLACGHVGAPGAGINMLTGQRNGQGGREWGQRCNQLPAGRDVDDPEHRRVVADRWGVDESTIPHSGLTYVEILQAAGRGEVRGLLSICTNMSVSAPDLGAVERQLAALDHFVVVDPFFSESARHADLVFPGTTFAEESGTITTIEGRVVRIDQAVEPLTGRSDIDIIRGIADRLDAGDHFAFDQASEVFDEMCAVSAGGKVDYAGMTWDRIRDEGGLFWPCPDREHPGTPQLHIDHFAHDDGRARFHVVDLPQPPEPVTESFPLVLTTGRSLSQFLSRNQTRRIERLNRTAAEPVLEVHPETALMLGLEAGQRVEVASRLGRVEMAWAANDGLRPDTVFVPYHWPVCNTLVAADLDPISRIPGFKYTAVAVRPAAVDSQARNEALTSPNHAVRTVSP